ncbi:hypothetical protein ABHM93_02415 [Micromonospora provocatoris]|uniref:hypothetical protein n=1 Tax=Bacillati TaxID=1783272 RepID=UPI0011686D37|nr:hypothetical protein [Lysinibacillus sp. CD3-6]QPQ34840.1 hypothetical protein JNUCC52_20210 [Lysinibacillus sp. JNUCC-52]UED79165.1 hypothetical protein FH508_0017140 [Lysinibacillus sp. CD3-6]
MDYEYTVKLYFNESREEEYKIKNNIGQDTFVEEILNGFNEKRWHSFTETENFKTILVSTNEVYKVTVVQNVVTFD